MEATDTAKPKTGTYVGRVAVMHGLLVTASPDGSVPLNAKVLADASRGSPEALAALVEVARRASAYPKLVPVLRARVEHGRDAIKTGRWPATDPEHAANEALLRDLGEDVPAGTPAP